MNRDIISKTPGGERILIGVILFVFGTLLFKATEFQVILPIRMVFAALAFFGIVQLGRGVIAWKYTDHKAFAENRSKQNLFVDVPIKNQEFGILHRIEDALIELVRTSKTVSIEVHSVDTANNIGTIHLCGKEADAMYVHVYATLARFALPNGIHLFPKPGQPIDTEINGKRVLMDIAKMEVHL